MNALSIFHRYFFLLAMAGIGMMYIITVSGCSGDGNREGDVDDAYAEEWPCDYQLNIDCGIYETEASECQKECNANSGLPDWFSNSSSYFIVFKDALVFEANVGCKDIWQKTMFKMDSTFNMETIMEYDSDTSWAGLDESLVLNDVLYFTKYGCLWKYDGSGAAERIAPDEEEGELEVVYLMAYNDKVFFQYYDHGSDREQNVLYFYDGIESQAAGEVCVHTPSHPFHKPDHIVYNGKLYFKGFSGSYGYGLWCYDDATAEPAYMAAEIIPSESTWIDSWGYHGSLVVFQGKLFFSAHDGVHGYELWMINGDDTPARVTDNPLPIRPATLFQGKLLCEVTDESAKSTTQFYEYDGSSVNAVPVDAEYHVSRWTDYYLFESVLLDDVLCFIGMDASEGGNYLWKYDGYNPPAKVNTEDNMSGFYEHGGMLYLSANGDRVYVYDGESEPEILFEPGSLGFSHDVFLLGIFFDHHFITGDHETYGSELWTMDSSMEFNLLEDFYPGTSCSCACGD